jgi:hypothetical protein
MVVRNKKTFGIGVVFTISFLAVLLLIFSPFFKGKNGLEFSDDSFNRLSKGSSYFIPQVAKSVEQLNGKALSANIKLDKAEDAEKISKLLSSVGAKTDVKDTAVKIEGDLGAILQSAIKDSDAMFKNDGKAVSDRYGYDEKTAMKNWWAALTKIEKNLKKDKLVAEAKVVSDVVKKAVEPGYNFYKIDGQKVADHAGMMSGLLVFYVIYTMWWGYAIFYLFDGLGLSMKKAKIKKEA